jgi:acetyl-CoA carboxylase carboxyltransferase component
MNWKPEMDELRRREEFAEALGGAERVKRQHDGGRLTIRERIGRLVDRDLSRGRQDRRPRELRRATSSSA